MVLKIRLAVFVVAFAALLATAPAYGGFRVEAESGTNGGGDYLMIYENDLPVLRYVRGEVLPEGVPEDRRRSSYIHPLFSLDGAALTDDFPKDHYHHRGLSWMWLRVSYDGKTNDLWTLKGIRQKYVDSESEADDTSARLRVRNGWFEDATGRKVVDEQVTIVARPADEHGRDILLTIELAAVGNAVSLGVSNTGYSGLNLRFAPRQDTAILTSRDPIGRDEDRKRYAWADLSGRFGGSDSYDGVAIFDMPSNPHFPAGWTLRFYGNLNPAFTANSADYTIEPGVPLRLDYVIHVHKGKGDTERLWRRFRQYAEAVNVQIGEECR